MIKVDKDFEKIPNILKSSNRKIAFNANVLACDYVDEKHRYKVNSIQKQLNDIYHLKCAYCEKKLLDALNIFIRNKSSPCLSLIRRF